MDLKIGEKKIIEIKNPLSVIDGLLERIGRKNQNSVGIAYGGGGAKGFSHLGVLMALQEVGIKPSVQAGVSAGSIAAVLYGAGLTPLEIRDCFMEAKSLNEFREWTVPKNGIFKLNRFAKLLESWLPVKNLEELTIPTVICATNLDRGTQVGWCKGEIVPRVIASCSLPLIFKPVKINGYHYVDGGVLHNLPAWAIRDYCDFLIGSNCSPLDRTYKYKNSIVDIAMRTFQLGMKANIIQDMNICDMVVMPPGLGKSKTLDLTHLDENLQLGYQTTLEILKTVNIGKYQNK